MRVGTKGKRPGNSLALEKKEMTVFGKSNEGKSLEKKAVSGGDNEKRVLNPCYGKTSTPL